MLNGAVINLEGLGYTSFNSNDAVADFISGNPNARGGAFVSTADFNRDGSPDVAVGTGIGSVGAVTVYNGTAILSETSSFTGSLANDVLNAFTVLPAAATPTA